MTKENTKPNTQYLYNQYDAQRQISLANKQKYDQFKKRIEQFMNIQTLEEAKELAVKILPTSKEISRFNIGEAKCTIINKEDIFRICLDSQEEFISFDFSK